MKVRVWVDKTTALRAGNDLYELQVVTFPASQLTDAQRLELSYGGTDPDDLADVPKRLHADFVLDDVLLDWPEVWGEPPRLAEPAPATVIALLDRLIAERAGLIQRTFEAWEAEQLVPTLRDRLVEVACEISLREPEPGQWEAAVEKRAFRSPLPPGTCVLGRFRTYAVTASTDGQFRTFADIGPLESARPALPGVIAAWAWEDDLERQWNPIHEPERLELLRRIRERLSALDVAAFATECETLSAAHRSAALSVAERELAANLVDGELHCETVTTRVHDYHRISMGYDKLVV